MKILEELLLEQFGLLYIMLSVDISKTLRFTIILYEMETIDRSSDFKLTVKVA